MHDLGLAIIHHVLVFGLVVMLATERTMLKAPTLNLPLLARLDGGYGLMAVLVLGVGALRVATGARGWAYYETNPWFWAKVAVFVAIGLISIGPTLRFLTWARSAKADPLFQPAEKDLARVRRLVGIELILIFPLVGFAAAMARYPFV